MATIIEQEIALHRHLIRSGKLPSCIGCEYWQQVLTTGPKNGPHYHCEKYAAVPPAEVIAVGCPEYTPDIPF